VQGLLPRRTAASGTDRQEAIPDALSDFGYTQARNASRHQLQRERKPVEASTDLRYGLGIRSREREIWEMCLDALDEQPNGFARIQLVDFVGDWTRQRERRHPPDRLARCAKRLQACDHHPQSGARSKESVHEFGTGSDEVFAVIQYKQDPVRTEQSRKLSEP
jgi:hypothetical protein